MNQVPTKPHVSYTYLVGSHELLSLLTYHMHLFTLQVNYLVPYLPTYLHLSLYSREGLVPTYLASSHLVPYLLTYLPSFSPFELWDPPTYLGRGLCLACFGEGHTLSLSLSQRVGFSVVFVYLAFARSGTCIFGE
jgi:hypothetical protein